MIRTTFDSTKQPLSEILKDVQAGTSQLPDFQRGWVWDDQHIRDLLASVSQSFPIGAVMMLEAGDSEVRFKPRPIEGADSVDAEPGQLILDGQQRITSLFQSLLAGKPVATQDPKGKPITRWYYVDIVKALDPDVEREDAILSVPADKLIKTNFGRDIQVDLSTPEKEYEAQLFPLSQVFDASDWRTGFNQFCGYDSEKTALWDRFEKEFIKHFEHYYLPVIELKRETPKEAVCLVFEKVNTGGVSLSVFELLTATFAADNFELRRDWDRRKASFDERPVLSDVANTDFLQAITLLTTWHRREEARSQGVDTLPPVTCKRRDVLNLRCADYQAWADQVEQGFHRAARFLHRERVFDSRFLPYSTQVVPLATLLTLLGKDAEDEGTHDRLVRWFWCGVFGELYGAATETRFANDIVDVRAWINGDSEPRTIVEANFAPERLLTLRTRRSAAYRGMYVLLLRQGARDFRTGEESSLQTYFDENIDIHHLFPKKWCKDRGVAASLYDSIINKTPLTARTNRIIGGNAPSAYLASIERNHGLTTDVLDAHLRTHFIDPHCIRSDNFEAFLEDRKSRLLASIGEVMGKQLEQEPEEAPSPEVKYEDTEPEPELDA